MVPVRESARVTEFPALDAIAAKVPTVPRAFRGLHPLVLREVARISGGDWQRCVVDDDGSVTILNSRAWKPE